MHLTLDWDLLVFALIDTAFSPKFHCGQKSKMCQRHQHTGLQSMGICPSQSTMQSLTHSWQTSEALSTSSCKAEDRAAYQQDILLTNTFVHTLNTSTNSKAVEHWSSRARTSRLFQEGVHVSFQVTQTPFCCHFEALTTPYSYQDFGVKCSCICVWIADHLQVLYSFSTIALTFCRKWGD